MRLVRGIAVVNTGLALALAGCTDGGGQPDGGPGMVPDSSASAVGADDVQPTLDANAQLDSTPVSATDPEWPADEPLAPEFDFPPYINMPAPNQIVVSWRTVEITTGNVHFGTTPAYGRTKPSVAGQLHHVVLGVLQPATAYYYEVEVDGTSARRKGVFVTPGAGSWRFMQIGEFHAAGESPNVAKFADEIRAFRPHVLVDSGDMLDDGDDMFRDHFVLPHNERWYTTRYGQVEFFSLDSTWGIKQPDIVFIEPGWVGREAAKAHDGVDDPTFVIGSWHYPACSSNRERRSADRIWVQENLIKNFKDNGGIDLVLVGHDKYYERSMIAGGILHIQTNTGKLRPGDEGGNHPACTVEKTVLDKRSITFVAVDGDALSGTVVTEEGEMLDSFTVAK
jgi:hypothetical protein